MSKTCHSAQNPGWRVNERYRDFATVTDEGTIAFAEDRITHAVAA